MFLSIAGLGSVSRAPAQFACPSLVDGCLDYFQVLVVTNNRCFEHLSAKVCVSSVLILAVKCLGHMTGVVLISYEFA